MLILLVCGYVTGLVLITWLLRVVSKELKLLIEATSQRNEKVVLEATEFVKDSTILLVNMHRESMQSVVESARVSMNMAERVIGMIQAPPEPPEQASDHDRLNERIVDLIDPTDDVLSDERLDQWMA